MEPMMEPTRDERRASLIVTTFFAVLIALTILFAWPW
jgi:hypothetical protein